jgi:hypothetical protein
MFGVMQHPPYLQPRQVLRLARFIAGRHHWRCNAGETRAAWILLYQAVVLSGLDAYAATTCRGRLMTVWTSTYHRRHTHLVRTKTQLVIVVLAVYGIYSTVLGLMMILSPGFFFDTVGGFGPRNNHYIFDVAAFELPLGLLYLAAIKWPGWRTPTLALATLHYGLHAISHLIDINRANTAWIGVCDFVVIAVGTAIHAVALWLSTQPQPDVALR